MRIISGKEVYESLPMPEAIEAAKSAFIELSSGAANVPERTHISIGRHKGTTLIMPAYLGKSDALACKIASVFPDNSAKGLPLVNAVVILLDAETGEILAAIEGASLTALRTGAASGLATDLLAGKDAKILAIFGAGVQGRTQAIGVCAVRNIKKVLVYDHNPTNAEKFVAEMAKEIDADLFIAQSPKLAVSEADVICTATTATEPVFDGNDLQAGTHINAVGSFNPQMQEIDATTLKQASKIIVDSREVVLREAGDLISAGIQLSDIYAEIGEIALGLKPAREIDSEITFFKSVGNAAQDAATALMINRKLAARI